MNRRNKGFTLLEKAAKEPLSSLMGFTLVELQIASAIALITLSAVLALYLFSWRSFTIGNTLLDVHSNSRNAFGWLTRDIRCAAQVIKQYPETGSPTYQTDDHVIILKVPSVDGSGNTLNFVYDHIIYKLQGSDLYRIVQKDASSSRPNENRIIAHYCDSLTFSSGGITLANIINLSTINAIAIYLPVNKTTTSVSGAGTQTASINPTTVVRLRNK